MTPARLVPVAAFEQKALASVIAHLPRCPGAPTFSPRAPLNRGTRGNEPVSQIGKHDRRCGGLALIQRLADSG